MEPWMLTMEAWRDCRPEVADSHHYGIRIRNKVNTSIWIRIEVKRWILIRIRIKVMRISNPALQ